MDVVYRVHVHVEGPGLVDAAEEFLEHLVHLVFGELVVGVELLHLCRIQRETHQELARVTT
jgi:hypothetical protein